MSKINKVIFPEYTLDMIENVMSLRKPQKQSVKILDSILDDIKLSKDIDLQSAQDSIHDVFPIFKDFEHPFVSLTFALATGVGKTKLTGAFITYLYTQKNIRNFFVVAPSLTIYNKLKNDLGNPAADNEKYVFRGVGCFSVQKPKIWADDDYRNKPLLAIQPAESINIYIFNISKFNSEDRQMKSVNEYLDGSFYDYLRSLDDLVVIMDESHHYRAAQSMEAINNLQPVLGLELTATPQVQQGKNVKLFENVVYEYPLSKAIKDGYTRTPYALTRKDIKSYNFNDDELDMTMINDGITHHENIKLELIQYSHNNGKKLVKPFMLIVCKDTAHAQKIFEYVKSNAFMEGKYADKVIMVHSNQKGAEKEENVQLLLDVEKTENPIEIVIHVNMLKEGWDVNNLYTIVPLRTATSKILREQTVGRGLRLPYGKRTGDKLVDSVTITAHDKFDEIISEAQSGDSILNADGIIYADYEQKKKIAVVQLSIDTDKERADILEAAGLDSTNEENRQTYNTAKQIITNAVQQHIKKANNKVTLSQVREAVERDHGEQFREDTDLQKIIELMFGVTGNNIVDRIQEKTMFIPKIRTEQIGKEQYIIQDFDLDLSNMVYVPIRNDLLVKNMIDSLEETYTLKGRVIDYNTEKPEKLLVDWIRKINEIDYEKCPKLIQKIVLQFLTHYRAKYTEQEVRSMCIMEHQDIIEKFKTQLIQHLAVKYDGIVDIVTGIETIVQGYYVDISDGVQNIAVAPKTGQSIKSIVYEGSRKSITDYFKFDSNPERLFALACDNSDEVIWWLRPAAKQFNITYNRGHEYRPDFVVETSDKYYLVEIKDREKVNDPKVLAKKERAIQYCKVATEYNKAHAHKGFEYLFIPDDQISSSSSFNTLLARFREK